MPFSLFRGRPRSKTSPNLVPECIESSGSFSLLTLFDVLIDLSGHTASDWDLPSDLSDLEAHDLDSSPFEFAFDNEPYIPSDFDHLYFYGFALKYEVAAFNEKERRQKEYLKTVISPDSDTYSLEDILNEEHVEDLEVEEQSVVKNRRFLDLMHKAPGVKVDEVLFVVGSDEDEDGDEDEDLPELSRQEEVAVEKVLVI